MLTGRASETDRVRGFARGADDYIVKPFHYPELAARIGAVLRRSRERRERGVLQVGELRIDPVSREVRLGERTDRAVGEGVRAAAHTGRGARRACSRRRSSCATCGASS